MLPVNAQVQADIAAAQAALAVPGALTAGSNAWTNAIVALQATQTDITAFLTTNNTTLNAVAGGASTFGILGTMRPDLVVTLLSIYTDACGNLAGTLQQQGYVNRATVNLQNASS